jgi:hypothetical protein
MKQETGILIVGIVVCVQIQKNVLYDTEILRMLYSNTTVHSERVLLVQK